MNKNIVTPISLRRNISWTFLGNIIYSGSQWGMMVVLAKIGTPQMVGKFALALAITTPIFMLTNLQLRVVQATDANDEYQFGDYLGLRMIMSAVSFLITVMVIVVTNYSFDINLIIVVMCIAKIIESIGDVSYGLMQKNEFMGMISISKILKGILSLIALGIFVWITNSLVIGTVALAFMWLIVTIFYDVKLVRKLIKFKPKPVFNYKTLISILKLSLPLGIVLMMGSLNNNLPRYFLEYYFDEDTLGYFVAMAYLIVAGNTVMSALGQSASPRLAKYYCSGNKKSFTSLTCKMMLIGIIIGIIGIFIAIFFGNELLTILYGKEYAKYSEEFVLIMIAGAILYVGAFVGYSITASRSFKIQPIIGTIWVISSFIGSVILIPIHGLRGAAYVLIITAIIQLVTKILVLVYVLYFKQICNIANNYTTPKTNWSD